MCGLVVNYVDFNQMVSGSSPIKVVFFKLKIINGCESRYTQLQCRSVYDVGRSVYDVGRSVYDVGRSTMSVSRATVSANKKLIFCLLKHLNKIYIS